MIAALRHQIAECFPCRHVILPLLSARAGMAKGKARRLCVALGVLLYQPGKIGPDQLGKPDAPRLSDGMERGALVCGHFQIDDVCFLVHGATVSLPLGAVNSKISLPMRIFRLYLVAAACIFTP